MALKCVGLIETLGLAAAVEAADTAVKSANVQLIGYEYTKGDGMCTVKVEGDVGAVKAAVAAASVSASKVRGVYSTKVIARPAEGIDMLLHNATETIGYEDPKAEKVTEESKEEPKPEPVQEVKEEEEPKPTDEIKEEIEPVQEVESEPVEEKQEELSEPVEEKAEEEPEVIAPVEELKDEVVIEDSKEEEPKEDKAEVEKKTSPRRRNNGRRPNGKKPNPKGNNNPKKE